MVSEKNDALRAFFPFLEGEHVLFVLGFGVVSVTFF